MIVTTTTCPTTTAGNEFCIAGVQNSTCDGRGTCACQPGFTKEDNSLQCTEVIVAFTPCGHSGNPNYCQSAVSNSDCIDGVCQCEALHTSEDNNQTCTLVTLTSTSCSHSTQPNNYCNRGVEHSSCQANVCDCNQGYAREDNLHGCTHVTIDSTTCEHSSDPDNYCSRAISNSVCSDSGICICAEGYSATPDYLECFRMTVILSPAMRVRVAADKASSHYTYSGFGRAYVQAIYSGNSADAQAKSDLIDGNVQELQTNIGNMYNGTYADMVSLVNDYTEWGMDQAYQTSVTEARNDMLTLRDAAAPMAADWDDCMLAPLLTMTRSLADQYEAYHQAAQTMADAAEAHMLHGTQWAIDYMNSEADLARSISTVLDDAMAQLSAQKMDAAGFVVVLEEMIVNYDSIIAGATVGIQPANDDAWYLMSAATDLVKAAQEMQNTGYTYANSVSLRANLLAKTASLRHDMDALYSSAQVITEDAQVLSDNAKDTLASHPDDTDAMTMGLSADASDAQALALAAMNATVARAADMALATGVQTEQVINALHMASVVEDAADKCKEIFAAIKYMDSRPAAVAAMVDAVVQAMAVRSATDINVSQAWALVQDVMAVVAATIDTGTADALRSDIVDMEATLNELNMVKTFQDRVAADQLTPSEMADCTPYPDGEAFCSAAIPNSLCIEGFCTCGESFTPVYTPPSQFECLEVTIGTTLCTNEAFCDAAVPNSVCSEGACQCKVGFKLVDNQCINVTLSTECTVNADCSTAITNSECIDGACNCAEGFSQDILKQSCIEIHLGQTKCLSSSANSDFCKAVDDHGTCIDSICQCEDGYSVVSTTECTSNSIVAGSCSAMPHPDTFCSSFKDNSKCLAGNCACADGYYPNADNSECNEVFVSPVSSSVIMHGLTGSDVASALSSIDANFAAGNGFEALFDVIDITQLNYQAYKDAYLAVRSAGVLAKLHMLDRESAAMVLAQALQASWIDPDIFEHSLSAMEILQGGLTALQGALAANANSLKALADVAKNAGSVDGATTATVYDAVEIIAAGEHSDILAALEQVAGDTEDPAQLVELSNQFADSTMAKSTVVELIATAYTKEIDLAISLPDSSLSAISDLLAKTTVNQLKSSISPVDFLQSLTDILQLINATADIDALRSEIQNLLTAYNEALQATNAKKANLEGIKNETIQLIQMALTDAIENPYDIQNIVNSFLQASFTHTFELFYDFMADADMSNNVMGLVDALRVFLHSVVSAEDTIQNEYAETIAQISILNIAEKSSQRSETLDDVGISLLKSAMNLLQAIPVDALQFPTWSFVSSALADSVQQLHAGDDILVTTEAVLGDAIHFLQVYDNTALSHMKNYLGTSQAWLNKIQATGDSESMNAVMQANTLIHTLLEVLGETSEATFDQYAELSSIATELKSISDDQPLSGDGIIQFLHDTQASEISGFVNDLQSSYEQIDAMMDLGLLTRKLRYSDQQPGDILASFESDTNVITDFTQFLTTGISDGSIANSDIKQYTTYMEALVSGQLHNDLYDLQQKYLYSANIASMTAAASMARDLYEDDAAMAAVKAIEAIMFDTDMAYSQTEALFSQMTSELKALNLATAKLAFVAPQNPDLLFKELQSLQSNIDSKLQTQYALIGDVLGHSHQLLAVIEAVMQQGAQSPFNASAVHSVFVSFPGADQFPALGSALGETVSVTPEKGALATKLAIAALQPMMEILSKFHDSVLAISHAAELQSHIVRTSTIETTHHTAEMGHRIAEATFTSMMANDLTANDVAPAFDDVMISSDVTEAEQIYQQQSDIAQASLDGVSQMLAEAAETSAALHGSLESALAAFTLDPTNSAAVAAVVSLSESDPLSVAATKAVQEVASENPTNAKLVLDVLSQYAATSDVNVKTLQENVTRAQNYLDRLLAVSPVFDEAAADDVSSDHWPTIQLQVASALVPPAVDPVVSSEDPAVCKSDYVLINEVLPQALEQQPCYTPEDPCSLIAMLKVEFISAKCQQAIVSSYYETLNGMVSELANAADTLQEVAEDDPSSIVDITDAYVDNQDIFNNFGFPVMDDIDINYADNKLPAEITKNVISSYKQALEGVKDVASVGAYWSKVEGVLNAMIANIDFAQVEDVHNTMLAILGATNAYATHIECKDCQQLSQALDQTLLQLEQAAGMYEARSYVEELSEQYIEAHTAASCSSDEACSSVVSDSVCIDNACSCKGGYFPSASQKECIEVTYNGNDCSHEIMPNFMCHSGVPGSKCINGKCLCPSGYSLYNGNCVEVIIGMTACESSETCNSVVENSQCTSGVCMCNTGYIHDETRKHCVEVILDQTSCHEDTCCLKGVEHSVCGEEHKCTCEEGYGGNDNTCEEIILEETDCSNKEDPHEYCSGIKGAECKDGTCSCKDGYAASVDNTCMEVIIGETDCSDQDPNFTSSGLPNAECWHGVTTCSQGYGSGVFGKSCIEVSSFEVYLPQK